MTLRIKSLLTIFTLGLSLLMLNANASTELSVSWDHYNMDGYFNTEQKGIPGVAFGWTNDDLWAGRLTYSHGDLWVGGNNRDFKSLRFDLERDFTKGFLVPYAVIGAAHTEQDWGYSKEGETATFGSVGLGLKMNLSDRLTLSVDARSLMDDILHQDGLMYAGRLTLKFGNTDHKIPPLSKEPNTVTTWGTSVNKLLFSNNSAELTLEHKKLIHDLVARTNVADIEVEGHASHPSTNEYNQSLSEQRVNNVVQYIYKIDPQAIVDSNAYGEDYATEDDTASRNVTITITTIEEVSMSDHHHLR